MPELTIIATEGAEMKGKHGYTGLAVLNVASEPRLGATRYVVVINAMAQGASSYPGAARLFLPPATARDLAHGLLDMAHELDGAGLKGGDVETCVTLVRGLVERWGENFENAMHEVNGGDLVDWIAEEFMPHALGVDWPEGGDAGH